MTVLRRLAVAALVVLPVPAALTAQDSVPRPPAVPSDVRTIDSIVSALYQTISGPVGQPRQWTRFMSLMHPDARLVPTGCDSAGHCRLRVFTPEQYRELADSALMALGFHERAIVNHVERFGNVAHVFSSYGSYRRDETAPFSRGINSIQLFWDGQRWWVLSIYWDAERPGNPMPPDMESAH